jgi:hypothetical protein
VRRPVDEPREADESVFGGVLEDKVFKAFFLMHQRNVYFGIDERFVCWALLVANGKGLFAKPAV